MHDDNSHPMHSLSSTQPVRDTRNKYDTSVSTVLTMYLKLTWYKGNYSTAQRQLDTRTCVNGKKHAGKLNEYMPNPRGCPSGLNLWR